MGGRGIAIVFVASTFLGLTFSASPQTQTTGRIAGMVKDAQGAVIIGAQVSIENPATADKHSVTTDTSGNYSILQLPPPRPEHVCSDCGVKIRSDSKLCLECAKQATRKTFRVGRRIGRRSENLAKRANTTLNRPRRSPMEARMVVIVALVSPSTSQMRAI